MNNRERLKAVMHYESYDRLPCVSFGYWNETLDLWAEQGHISREAAELYRTARDSGPGDKQIMEQLGFDFNWACCIGGSFGL